MHKATFKVTEPDGVKMTMSCEATVKTWRQVAAALKEALNDGYDHHTNELMCAILDAIQEVDKTHVGLSPSDTP